jgi:two-component system, chemotaxis family, protein-glutamate methylesterase/glutaminase
MTGIGDTRLIAIGGSLGGIEAVSRLLGSLPEGLPAVAIVLHRRARDPGRLDQVLGRHSRIPVIEPDDKTPLVDGHAYLAPADYHLLVEPGCLSLSTEGPVRHARPAIDVLFESAADAYGHEVVAVVLTGASDDGARGAAEVRSRGGRVLVQHPDEARAPVAPRAAIAAGTADHVLPLDAIAAYLAQLRPPTSPSPYLAQGAPR